MDIHFIMFIVFCLLILLASFLLLFAYDKRKQRSDVLENVNIVYWSWDKKTEKLNISDNIFKFCQISQELDNIEEEFFTKVVCPHDFPKIKEAYCDIVKGNIKTLEFRLVCADKKTVWVEARIIRILNHKNKVIALSGVLIDISKRKYLEEINKEKAYIDAVTKLPTRHYLKEYLEDALLKAECLDQNIILVFIDLKKFKKVNDSYGYLIGDLLLEQVGDRIREVLSSKHFIGRLGGDKFLLVLENVQKKEMEKAIGLLKESFSKPFFVEDIEININLDFGVSYFPEDGRDMKKLIYMADRDMYKAK